MTNPDAYPDAELTPAQQAVKTVADGILALKPEGNPLTTWSVATLIAPYEVRDRLALTKAGSLMLQTGDSLSAPQPNDYWPDIHLYVSDETLTGVSLRAWGWQFEKYRIDPAGSQSPPYDVISFPGEYDWARRLDIALHYSDSRRTATQTLRTYTSSHNSGNTPSLSRDVYTMEYAETGYEGHNQAFLETVVEEDILAFTGLCRQLLEHRVVTTDP